MAPPGRSLWSQWVFWYDKHLKSERSFFCQIYLCYPCNLIFGKWVGLCPFLGISLWRQSYRDESISSPYLREHNKNAHLSTSIHRALHHMAETVQSQNQGGLCASILKASISQTFRRRDLLDIMGWLCRGQRDAESHRWLPWCHRTLALLFITTSKPVEWR